MGNLKSGISQKRLIVERSRRKFGTRGTAVHICRVLWCPIPWLWCGVIQCTFAKFPIPRFSKHYSFNSFHQISTKLHTKYHNQGLIQAITFCAICQKLKILWHFEFLLNTGPYEAGNFKTLLPTQLSSHVSQTLWGHWATTVEYRLLLFLPIGQVLKILWNFEILT